jgi:hypothetical protein
MTTAMTCQQLEELVPRLLDGEIEMSAAARAHIDGCEACRSLVADLRAIQAGAAALPALEPRRDLWSGIAARIEAPVVPLASDNLSRPGHRQISWRVAGIAAAILVVTTTAITYRVVRRIQPTPTLIAGTPDETLIPVTAPPVATLPTPAAGQSPTPTTGGAKGVASGGQARSSAPVTSPPAHQPTSPPVHQPTILLANNSAAKVDYDREIMRLRAIVDSGRTRLDPATVALLDRNLRIIDTAIVQCRDALAKDPASSFLIESLNSAYQTKVKLLRIAAAASAG